MDLIPEEVRKNAKFEFVPESEQLNDTSKVELNDKEQIQNLELMTDNIVNLLEYISEPDIHKLELDDHHAFTKHMEEKYEEFSMGFPNIFKQLLDTENRDTNIIKLLDMISLLKEVQSGKRNMQVEFEHLKERLANEYIYPKFGSKEAFEEKMKRTAQRKHNRAKKSQNK